MAGIATDLRVPTDQWIIGFLIMVEPGLFPVLRTMAGMAFIAIAPAMRIIQGMTCKTLAGSILMTIIRMTALAQGIPVLTF